MYTRIYMRPDMFRPVLHDHPQMHVKAMFSALSVQNMTFVKYSKYFVLYITFFSCL